MASSDDILDLAREAGFDLAALTPLGPPEDGERLRQWVAKGHQGSMEWIDRQLERILDPRTWNASPATLLIVGLGHAREAVELEGGGRVARYAAGRDYHNLMSRRLRKLGRNLVARGLAKTARTVVDAGALFERSHAATAGLGVRSKAANLLHPVHGPWFFLGELILEADLEPRTPKLKPVSCGTCTACLDVCPTDAFTSPGELDARRCLSYHTIESPALAPHDQRDGLGAWVFGCDLCSEVCPWGHKAPDASATFGTHPAVERGSLLAWLRTPEAEFKERFQGSPIQRPKRAGLARNAALALADEPTEQGRDGLVEALQDASPGVRAAAGWSLVRAFGDGPALERVKRAHDTEADPSTRQDLAESLERGPRREE